MTGAAPTLDRTDGASSDRVGESMDAGRKRTIGRALGPLVAAGWLLGLAIQVAVWARTGAVDVLPPSILLGLALCAGAGAADRLGRAAPRTRSGASAGILVALSIVAGYAIFVATVSGPASDPAGGETWLSLVLEGPLWLGIPVLSGAICGAFGWLLTDRMAS